MTIVVGCVGQKGGPGKSTMARLLGVAIASADATVQLAELDHTQKTLWDWSLNRDRRRAEALEAMNEAAAKGKRPKKEITVPPRVPVKVYDRVDLAMADSGAFDFFVLDAPGRTGPEILQIAQASDILVMPCNPGGDDMRPTVRVFSELVRHGVSRNKILCVLNDIGNATEEDAARVFLGKNGANVLPVGLPGLVAYRSALTAGLSPAEVTHTASREKALAVAAALLTEVIKVYGGSVESDEHRKSGEAA